ncbi:hypothetical protein OS493_024603 [Desmophyllum pertusum]|uniref:Uncharacterized protein n=1 Tax=Desmophyllum pertusum TaxID=174260 RepID=A0A9X0A054_9CNID|nr:hypothetical protein OS493_024598 [Desmophyllum pertusum]KAJ7390565.1 hypothetical protein OS493_024603 [Desmophyllum pertusum]
MASFCPRRKDVPDNSTKTSVSHGACGQGVSPIRDIWSIWRRIGLPSPQVPRNVPEIAEPLLPPNDTKMQRINWEDLRKKDQRNFKKIHNDEIDEIENDDIENDEIENAKIENDENKNDENKSD